MPENVTLIGALVAGGVSFLSPCVLPLVPGYLSLMSGVSVSEMKTAVRPARVVGYAACFVLGFSLVFVAMGAGASTVGQVLREHKVIFARVAGGVIILFGLHFLGVFRLMGLYKERRFQVNPLQSPWGSFLMGLAFAFGWTPCIGPILAGILSLAALQETVARGMVLLGFYSLGLGVPFLLSAIFVNLFFKFFESFRRYFHVVEVAAGLLLIVVGALIFSNQLTKLIPYLSFLNRFAL